MYLPYCDGASWAGRATHITRKRVPHLQAREKVYYRGNYVLDATIDELLARGMDRADEVVVSGASAGGLAVYLHVDTWAAKIAAAAEVRDESCWGCGGDLSGVFLARLCGDEPNTLHPRTGCMRVALGVCARLHRAQCPSGRRIVHVPCRQRRGVCMWDVKESTPVCTFFRAFLRAKGGCFDKR